MASAYFGQGPIVLEIKDYKIQTDNENTLGSGAFGVVFKSKKTGESTTVAAKRINSSIHPGILSRDTALAKLLDLDHTNVVQVFDFHQENETFWLFMEFCEHGDLNTFFRKQNVNSQQKSEIMVGITKGIIYLHENNIIHRDIKPANIIIKHVSPVVPKLTDFDLSKFFDPDVETSAMNTDVGTLAFKAPEFFNRVGGRLRYHRNVDIYACALTFLAIIQAQDGTRKLTPRIETPRDESELHVFSIGQLIAERIKYNVPELNIVRLCEDEREVGVASRDYTLSIRRLIQEMTCIDPEERLKADQVLLYLEQVRYSVSKRENHWNFTTITISYFENVLFRISAY